jgi:hypothetical protein
MSTEAGQDMQRVLDGGLVIAGDVEVKLLGLKVLPIKVRLLLGSTAMAESLGINWWPRTGRGNATGTAQRAAQAVSKRNGAARGRNSATAPKPRA